MKSSLSLTALICFCFLVTAGSACRSTVPESRTSGSAEASSNEEDKKLDALASKINESQEELARVTAEAKINSDRYTELQAEIDEKNALLESQENMSAEQKALVQEEIDKLTKQLQDLESQNKALKEKQAGLEKQVNESKTTSPAPNTAGTSGFPFCGSVYYGTVFNCNGKSCGKSDPQYVNICEITANSRPAASPNAAAGAGSSGYPFCPSPRYGTDFACNNNRVCAKSDPNYVNICEVR